MKQCIWYMIFFLGIGPSLYGMEWEMVNSDDSSESSSSESSSHSDDGQDLFTMFKKERVFTEDDFADLEAEFQEAFSQNEDLTQAAFFRHHLDQELVKAYMNDIQDKKGKELEDKIAYAYRMADLFIGEKPKSKSAFFESKPFGLVSFEDLCARVTQGELALLQEFTKKYPGFMNETDSKGYTLTNFAATGYIQQGTQANWSTFKYLFESGIPFSKDYLKWIKTVVLQDELMNARVMHIYKVVRQSEEFNAKITFDNLCTYVHQEELDRLKEAAKNNPGLMVQTDSKGNTLTNLAAMNYVQYGNQEGTKTCWATFNYLLKGGIPLTKEYDNWIVRMKFPDEYKKRIERVGRQKDELLITPAFKDLCIRASQGDLAFLKNVAKKHSGLMVQTGPKGNTLTDLAAMNYMEHGTEALWDTFDYLLKGGIPLTKECWNPIAACMLLDEVKSERGARISNVVGLPDQLCYSVPPLAPRLVEQQQQDWSFSLSGAVFGVASLVAGFMVNRTLGGGSIETKK